MSDKKPQTLQPLSTAVHLRLDPEQFKSLERTILRSAVVQGLLACGRLPLNRDRLNELKTIIENVEGIVL